MNNHFTNLDEIKPFKAGWRIQVKILHSWKQFTAQSGETLEVILADEIGVKIHDTCKKNLVNKFGKLLGVGEWKIIQNFNLSNASGQYRSTQHVYKMSFQTNTLVTQSGKKCSNSFTTLVDFDTILSGTLKQCFLIDVLGQVLDVGEIQNVMCAGKERKKLEFTLRNINDQRIACCLWGKFAETVQSACQADESSFVLCLIRFAKIGIYRKELQVSNAFDASLVIINPEIKEAKELIESFKDNCSSITITEKHELFAKSDGWGEYPDKTISEVLQSTQAEKCKVICTISAYDTDWGWYYFGCAIHNKKVTEHSKTKTIVNGIEIVKRTWWCEVCEDIVTNVKHRFKLHFIVKDDTDETKLMLLDTAAMEIVKASAFSLLKGSFDELEDPNSLPVEITNLVGQTYKFGITIEKDNVQNGNDFYKAMKVWSCDELVLTESASSTGSQSNKGTTLISGSEESFLLTNSEENSDVHTTPSSKRLMEDGEDAPDLTSTSKKVYTKKIKVEKITEEEMATKKK